MYKFTFKHYLEYVATLAVAVYSAEFGVAIAWPSPVLPQLLSDDSPIGVKLNVNQGSWVVSLLFLGLVFGYASIGTLMDFLGRKTVLLASTLLVLASWLMLYFAKSVGVLYVARFLQGIAVAVPNGVSGVYIAEISQPKHRGQLSIFNIMMIEIGVAAIQTIGSCVTYHTLAVVSATLPVVFLVLFAWMPETPYFYMKNDDKEAARTSLRRLRGVVDVDKELVNISDQVKQEMSGRRSAWDIFRKVTYRRALVTILGLKVFQQITGSTAIVSYMEVIFSKASSGLRPDVSSILCTTIPLPIMLGACLLVDRRGRRPLYFASALGCAAGLFCIFIYFFLQDYEKQDVSAFGWMPLTGLILFVSFRSVGITPVPYIILGELFATNVKGTAVSLSLMVGGTMSFLISRYFLLCAEAFGLYSIFAFFLVCCMAAFTFVYFFLPETKGKSLAEIQTQIEI